MTSVARYDLRNAEAELLQAGLNPALIRYLDAPGIVAAGRQGNRRRTLCGPLGTLAAVVTQRLYGLSQSGTRQLPGVRRGESPYARSGALSKGLRKQPPGLLRRPARQVGWQARWLAHAAVGSSYLDGSGSHQQDTRENQAVFP